MVNKDSEYEYVIERVKYIKNDGYDIEIWWYEMMVKFNFDPTLFGHSFFITLIIGFSIIAICEYIGVLWYGFR